MKRKWGYWKDEENIRRELEKAYKTKGYFPTQDELEDIGLGGLVCAITRKGETLSYWCERLGYPVRTKPNGYWKIFDNLKKELQPLIKDNKFPTQETIVANIGSRAIFAIYNYHGGLKEVAAKLGCEINAFHITSDGHYVNSANEYLLDEYLSSRGIEHEVNDLISERTQHCFDFKIDEYYIEIWGYEKGRVNSKIVRRYNEKRKEKEKIYEELDLKLISIESDIFKNNLERIEKYFDGLFAELGYDISKKDVKFDIKNVAKHCYFWNEQRVVREVNEEIEKNYWKDFPTLAQLKDVGRGDLGDAIKKFGGYPYFRKKLGYDLHHKPDGYWNDETIQKELKLIIKKIGHFPLPRELKELGRNDLVRAINRNGGFGKFQKLLGFEQKVKPNGYWTKKRMITMLKEIWQQLGKRPTYSNIRELDKTLCSAIDRSEFKLTELLNEINGEIK